AQGLLELDTDKRSRTYVVTRFGSEMNDTAPASAAAVADKNKPRRRRGSGKPGQRRNGGEGGRREPVRPGRKDIAVPAEAAAAPSGRPLAASRRRTPTRSANRPRPAATRSSAPSGWADTRTPWGPAATTPGRSSARAAPAPTRRPGRAPARFFSSWPPPT